MEVASILLNSFFIEELECKDEEERISVYTQLFVFRCISQARVNSLLCPEIRKLLCFWNAKSTGNKDSIADRLISCVCPISKKNKNSNYHYCDYLERTYGKKLERKIQHLNRDELNALAIFFLRNHENRELMNSSSEINLTELCNSIVYSFLSAEIEKLRLVNLRIIAQIFGILNSVEFDFYLIRIIGEFIFTDNTRPSVINYPKIPVV